MLARPPSKPMPMVMCRAVLAWISSAWAARGRHALPPRPICNWQWFDSFCFGDTVDFSPFAAVGDTLFLSFEWEPGSYGYPLDATWTPLCLAYQTTFGVCLAWKIALTEADLVVTFAPFGMSFACRFVGILAGHDYTPQPWETVNVPSGDVTFPAIPTLPGNVIFYFAFGQWPHFTSPVEGFAWHIEDPDGVYTTRTGIGWIEFVTGIEAGPWAGPTDTPPFIGAIWQLKGPPCPALWGPFGLGTGGGEAEGGNGRVYNADLVGAGGEADAGDISSLNIQGAGGEADAGDGTLAPLATCRPGRRGRRWRWDVPDGDVLVRSAGLR